MNCIKAGFRIEESHLNRNSHRTSNGFLYSWIDQTKVSNLFLSDSLHMSYQDMYSFDIVISQIRAKKSKCSDDCFYGDGGRIEDDYYREYFDDLGICTIFNNAFSEKYGITLIPGSIEDCNLMFGVDENDILTKINKIIDYSKVEHERLVTDTKHKICEIEQKIKELKHQQNVAEYYLKQVDSDTNRKKLLMKNLYKSLLENTDEFDMNVPVVEDIYPLDVAIFAKDYLLVDTLISVGARVYSSSFDPVIGAKTGDYTHFVKAFNNGTISIKDVENFFDFLANIPKEELLQLVSGREEVKRNGNILLSASDKVCFHAIDIHKIVKESTSNTNIAIYIIASRCLTVFFEEGCFTKAEKIFYWLQNHFEFPIEFMILMAIAYEDSEFLDKLGLTTCFELLQTARYDIFFTDLEGEYDGCDWNSVIALSIFVNKKTLDVWGAPYFRESGIIKALNNYIDKYNTNYIFICRHEDGHLIYHPWL